MDGEAVSGLSPIEKERPFMMDVEEVGEPDVEELGEPDVEELGEPDVELEDCSTKRLYKETKLLLNKKMWYSGNSGAEHELCEAESSGFLPVYPVCVPQDRWGIKGGEDEREQDIQNKLLRSCCTAEGSIDLVSPSSMLEHWVYLDNQHNTADGPVTTTITPPATPVTHMPYPFVPVPSSVTASAMSAVVDPMIYSPMTHTCSPISSMCSPTDSAWDTLRSTYRSPSCCDLDPVSAAAHLHLLGESLSLIGSHLQETNKVVNLSSSSSLLLDSLLCALAPLICLTEVIPELRSCTQHTLASTLENIAYVMPGL